jgi:hypothetical protein
MCLKYTLSYQCVDCRKTYRVLPEQEKICEEAIKKRRTCKAWTKTTHDVDSGRCNECMDQVGCVMRPAGETGRENATRLMTRREAVGEVNHGSGLDVNGLDLEQVETDNSYGLNN